MKHNQLAKLPFASLALLGLSMVTAQAAQVYWKADTVGDWNTLENWSADWNAVPVVNQFPVSGDWARMGAGTSEIKVTTNVDIGDGFFWSNSGYNSVVMDGTAAPTWNSGSIYLSTPEDATIPGFTLEDGTVTIGGGRSLIMAWNNASNALGWFVQKAGTVTIAGDVSMCLKSSTQVAQYDLEGGSFSANNIRMGAGSTKYTAVFTQTGGSATVGNQIQMGGNMVDASNPDSRVIYNLDGGELTIEGLTPFEFTQTAGVDVYFDFDGGALNLLGTWDFASLTAIANSDFRVEGMPATVGNLHFEAVTINSAPFTRITTVMEPRRVITEVRHLSGCGRQGAPPADLRTRCGPEHSASGCLQSSGAPACRSDIAETCREAFGFGTPWDAWDGYF